MKGSSVDQAVPSTSPTARLRWFAERFGDTKAALIEVGRDVRADRRTTYRELDALSDRYAARLSAAGIGAGVKTIIMVPSGSELYVVVFAVLKLGAVPVLVDPGMKLSRMLGCYRAARAEAFVGVPRAQLLRLAFRGSFSTLRTVVTTGRPTPWARRTLHGGTPATAAPTPSAPEPDDLLLISFTTGSTGAAKGVETTFGALTGTTEQVCSLYGHTEADRCLVTSPSFGFLHLLVGATCVLPRTVPARVASTDPRMIADVVERFRATAMFGSPALLDPLARYLDASGRTLPSLRCVVSGGAPVSTDVVGTLQPRLAEGGLVHVTYGATEALPITSIDAGEILEQDLVATAEDGVCVGRPVPGLSLRIIRITDDPLPQWSDSLLAPPGEIGEIVISGPTVSRCYHAHEQADRTMKIAGEDRVWHRTGDVGRIDSAGRVWFCGRKSEIVETAAGPLYTVPCERVFDTHPDVYRSALVGVGPRPDQKPVLCVELRGGTAAEDWPVIEAELRELGGRYAAARPVRTFLPRRSLPVDIRHNAKIDRARLARWARRKT